MLISGVLAAVVIAQPRLGVQTVAAGLETPVAAAAAPEDTGRLFVAELGGTVSPTGTGKIKIIDLPAGGVRPTPFLSMSVGTGGERGLLGLAFDPAYQANGHFFVHHSTAQPQGTHIARFTVSSDPNVADPLSERQVFFEPHVSFAHQGGWMEFGPDGFLYLALGDIGTGNNAQLLTSPFGKLLRLDVSSLPYSIPPTNPFAGSTTARREIWAYGLRNPWRCGFDRATGDLWMGDVGEQSYEEINFQPTPPAPPLEARNYGWPLTSGPGSGFGVPPIYYYAHASGVDYVVGGQVYRGAAIPWLRGAYFFFRRGSSSVWSLRYDGAAVSDLTSWTGELQPAGGALTGVVSFAEDARGELYMVSLAGAVYRIVPRCPANCDGSVSPVLGAADFMCFQNHFALGDPYADCNGDGLRNLADFGRFMTGFALGCP